MTVTPDDFFDNAPCGLLCATTDRRITAVNAVLAGWLGYPATELIGRRFTELFNPGARIHYETHFGPLLHVNGAVTEMAVDLVAADGARLPVLITANVKEVGDGSAQRIRMAVHDARNRRSYERELLEERRRAEVLASTLQSSLLPPLLSPPPAMEAAAHYHAATDEVGGDFYDLFPLTADAWGFFLGDVAGKGAPAAAVTSLTRYALRAAAVMDDDPVSVLRTLDKVLHQRAPEVGATLATVIFGTVRPTPAGADVHLASGGHPPALLLESSGGVTEVITDGGQPVGVLRNPNFVDSRLRLYAGDTLVLYSDGLTEARTGPGPRRFNDDGALLRFARAHAPCGAPAIVAALRDLLVDLGSGVEDDVALLALGVPARP